jgi:hypothetical protein
MQLYRYVPVWKRTADGLVLYRCFEVVGLGYTVQSKDFFGAGRLITNTAHLESQFLELLWEQAPEERSKVKPTIQDAVESFDAYFQS